MDLCECPWYVSFRSPIWNKSICLTFCVLSFKFTYAAGFIAGNGYAMTTFQISSKFNGEVHQIAGDYIPVMFENQTMPILGGREYLGVPKIYADIPPIKLMSNGHIRCETSLGGHMMFGIELPPMKKQNSLVKTMATRQICRRPFCSIIRGNRG